MKPALVHLPPMAAGQLKRARKNYNSQQFPQCIDACLNLLKKHPDHPEVLKLCGYSNLKLGNLRGALEFLVRLSEIGPINAEVSEDIATVLMHEKAYASAIPFLEHCINASTWREDIAFSIGFCHQESGNTSAALEAYSAVIARNPKMLDSYLCVAQLLHQAGKNTEAIELLELALQVNEGSVELLYCQAKIMAFQGLFATALQKFEKLVLLGDSEIEHMIDHAELLARMKKLDEAIDKFLTILERNPKHHRALTSYGHLLFQLKRNDDALALFEKIINQKPNDAGTLVNIANVYSTKRDFVMAKEYFGKAYSASPHGREIAGSYLYTMSFLCDWRDHAKVLETIESDQTHTTSRTFPSIVYENNPASNLAYAEAMVKTKFRTSHILGDLKAYARKEKIRIGYYSSDLYHHATVMLIEGMLREHDRSQFEIYAFSLDAGRVDAYSARVRSLFDHYHDVSGLSDGAVTLLSRQLEIDIAIDLKGFTEGSRTSIFAERAAPIQINYLGFPGSMGAPFMDYMIADHYTVNPNNRPYFSEKIIWMPDCYQPNNPGRPNPNKASPRPAELPAAKFVFCSFNNTYKLTPKVFDLWMRILKQAPDSVLWLLKTTEEAEKNLLDYVRQSGVDTDRIIFAPMQLETDHLQRFVHADLFMDSFPCNAHTTASDALWAGVPLITRSGETFASRVAGSILHAAGLPELIVDTEEAYELLALKIYSDRNYHRQLKERVRDGIDHGPLYDAKAYTRHFERALLEIHERHHSGSPPEDLDVASLTQASTV